MLFRYKSYLFQIWNLLELADTIASLLAIETVWLSMAIFVRTIKLLQLIRFNPHIY